MKRDSTQVSAAGSKEIVVGVMIVVVISYDDDDINGCSVMGDWDRFHSYVDELI